MTHLPSNDELLQTYLAGNDVPCPMCAYNLRGLEDGHCPECGEQLSLHIRPESYRYAPLITALIGYAMGLGFAVIIGCWLIWAALSDRWWYDAATVGWNIGSIAILGIALVLLAGLQRRFRRSPRLLQWSIAASGFILSTIGAIGFFTIVE